MQEHEVNGGGTPVESKEDRQAGMAQAEAQAASAGKAAAGMDEAAVSGKRIAPESTLRVFLSPQHPNTKYLVRVGKVLSFKAQDSPSGMRDTAREGDVWAQFSGGVLATDDPIVIAWCEAHGPDEDLHREYHRARDESTRGCRAGHGVCCDAKHPNAAPWNEMKAHQIPTSSREATMAPSMDIDALIKGAGGPVGGGDGEGKRLMDAARNTAKAHEAAKERD